jgi:hypothetical protein
MREFLKKLFALPETPVEVVLKAPELIPVAPAAPEEPLRFFTPNYDFHSPELRSHYTKNATYTIRPGKNYDRLRSLADGEWSRRGMIKFLPAHPGSGSAARATILGSAIVKEK